MNEARSCTGEAPLTGERMLRLTDYAPNSAMAAHHHDEPSIIVVMSGSYAELIDGVGHTYSAGETLWYPAGATHSQRFGRNGARKVVLTPDAQSLEYLRENGFALSTPSSLRSPRVVDLACRIATEMNCRDPHTNLAREGMSLELVALVARGSSYADSHRAPRWLRLARDMLVDSGDARLSVHQVAAEVGRHPVHLAREFRRCFGSSIGEYRRQLQLIRAQSMLGGRLGLSEIALSCGFASHSHFCRVFKAAYGMTPSAYRSSRNRKPQFNC